MHEHPVRLNVVCTKQKRRGKVTTSQVLISRRATGTCSPMVGSNATSAALLQIARGPARGLCLVHPRGRRVVAYDLWPFFRILLSIRSRKNSWTIFFPDTPFFSFGAAGCNLACKFCQNWDISKAREIDRPNDRVDLHGGDAARLRLGGIHLQPSGDLSGIRDRHCLGLPCSRSCYGGSNRRLFSRPRRDGNSSLTRMPRMSI
jgi:hypothetical protein